MAKYCKSCGAELSDNAAFCTTCGAKSEEIEQTTNQTTGQAETSGGCENVNPTTVIPAKSSKKDTYIGIGAVAIVAIIIISLISGLFSGGYKKPIDNFVKGINKQDADLIVKAFPEYITDAMKKIPGGDATEQLADEVMNAYGDKVKVSYKIIEKEKIDKKDLKDVENGISLIKKVKVSKGYDVEVEFTISDDGEKKTEKEKIRVLKIDGKWSLSPDLF